MALAREMDEAGYRYRLAPVSIAEELHRSIVDVRDRGLLSPDLYERYAGYWRFVPPPGFEEPLTLIVVAWPSSATKVRFQLAGGVLDAVIPPTYTSSTERARSSRP